MFHARKTNSTPIAEKNTALTSTTKDLVTYLELESNIVLLAINSPSSIVPAGAISFCNTNYLI
jgi:hypothetical protein